MADKKEVAAKRLATMIEKYGSEEAYRAELVKWAALGGKKSGGGFRAMTKEQRSDAGKKGHAAMIKKAKEGV